MCEKTIPRPTSSEGTRDEFHLTRTRLEPENRYFSSQAVWEKKLHRAHCRGLSQIIDSFWVSVDDAKLSVNPTAQSRAAGSKVGRFVSLVTHEGLGVTHSFPRLPPLNNQPIRRFAFIHSAAARRPKGMRAASHGQALVCVLNLIFIHFLWATWIPTAAVKWKG